MKCKNCGGTNHVVTTAKDDQNVYRLRECDVCKNRWHTVECESNDSEIALAIYRIRNKMYKD